MPLAITPRRLAANRENAAKSTGPRTPEGKQRSSKNSLHHAAFCADLLQPGEDEHDLHTLRDALIHDLAPQNAIELCLADRVVSAAWRLRRLQHADRCLALMEDADVRAEAADHNRRLAQSLLDEDEDDEDNPENDADDPTTWPVDLPDPLAPGLLIARALRAPTSAAAARHATSPFERLLAAEVRLSGMMARALRDLRQLRLDRRDPARAPDDHTPFATPDLQADDDDAAPTDDPPPPSPEGAHGADTPPAPSPAGEGGGEGRSATRVPSSSPPSSNPQISDSKSSPSVPSVVNPPLQNEPTCHSGSPAPADLLARAAALAAQSLPHRRKEPRTR
jgi:hypothetical protein